MKVKYWVLIFVFYILALIVQEAVSTWDLVGFGVLVIAFMADQKKNRSSKKPCIIGEHGRVEYMTPEELVKRVGSESKMLGEA